MEIRGPRGCGRPEAPNDCDKRVSRGFLVTLKMAGNTQMRLELYGYHQQSTAEVYEMPSGSVA